MKFHHSDTVRYLSFDIFPPEVIQAVFTRQGGISPEPWNSLNVGGTVGDERHCVRENRQRAFRALGRDPQSLFDVWQVHSADVVLANAPHASLEERVELKADAILTDNPAVTLFMRFADCTPILLHDPVRRAVGIIHAGWVGTLKQAAGEAVRAMTAAYGSRPADIRAAIGPSIGPDHYEVGPEVEEQARYVFGSDSEALFQSRPGSARLHFDLWAANTLSLRRAGVEQIEVAGLCTACHPEDWYSHRAQHGKTGRFGALIALA